MPKSAQTITGRKAPKPSLAETAKKAAESTVNPQWLAQLDLWERQRYFRHTLEEAGFVFSDPWENYKHIKHYRLSALTCSFIMDDRTMQIFALTTGIGRWTYHKDACYQKDGEWLVRHPLTIPVITSDEFIEYQRRRVRLMTEEILNKLDKRSHA